MMTVPAAVNSQGTAELRIDPGPRAATPASATPIDQLRKLVELKEVGVLTDEEFALMKNRIVNEGRA